MLNMLWKSYDLSSLQFDLLSCFFHIPIPFFAQCPLRDLLQISDFMNCFVMNILKSEGLMLKSQQASSASPSTG